MAELPKIVRERLRGQTVTDEHPDANLLSAFAEQTLTDEEHAQLLEHLSRCAQCRAVVALSAPALAEQEVLVAPAAMPAPKAAQGSWWRSPVVRWGALGAAALVVLIAVGGYQFQLRERRMASAPAISRYGVAAQLSQPSPPPPPPPPPKSTQLPELVPAPRTPSAAQAFDKLSAQRAESPTVSSPKKASKNSAVAAAPLAAPPPSAPSFSAGISENSDAGKTGVPLVESGNLRARVEGAPSANQKVKVEAATPTVEPSAPIISSAQRQAPRMGGGIATAKSIAVLPRWSISGTGVLQRSLDGGSTWSEVPLAGGVTFRSVSAVGKDVWVGGSGGALFHSSDGGEHWTPVHVLMDGRSLTGDIITVEFADAAHGVVSTTTGEIWNTSDGTNWRLQ